VKKDKKKVLLIMPRTDDSLFGSHLLPVPLAYIAASLRKNNIDVMFVDFEREGDKAKKRLDELLGKWSPHFVGFSILQRCVNNALSLAKYIRERKESILVAGGMYPSVYPEKLLKDNLFDYVIRGDGEIPFTHLVLGKPDKEIEGLYFKDKKTGEKIDKGVNYQPLNLDLLPFPDYETIPYDRYKIPPLGIFLKLPCYPMFASRGCEGVCTFCTSYEYNKTYRMRSPENIIAEIEKALADYKMKEIYFLDANFSYNKLHTQSLCEALIKRELPVSWQCSTRISHLDKELLEIMKQAGCIAIAVALESADTNILKKIKKTYNLKEATSLLEHADKLGLFIKHNYMYGVPSETKESMNKTLDLALKLPSDIAIFHLFNLNLMVKNSSGAPIEDDYKRLVKEGNQAEINELFPLVSHQEIKSHFLKSYLRFYFRPYFFKRFFTKKINLICMGNNLKSLFPCTLFVFFFIIIGILRRFLILKINKNPEITKD